MKMKLRLTREVRDLVVTMLVAVAGAGSAWALSNAKSESIATLAVVLAVVLVLAVAAMVLKAVQAPSEDPGKNAARVLRRVAARDPTPKAADRARSTPKKALAP